jgi:hypothetical protein
MMIIAEMAGLVHPEVPPAQEEHGHRHRQSHEEPGLHRPHAHDRDEQVGECDPEGHRQGQLDRAAAALAHRQPQHDDRRYRGERGSVYPEEQDGHEPRDAGGQRRLEDQQPHAPETVYARAQALANHWNHEN